MSPESRFLSPENTLLLCGAARDLRLIAHDSRLRTHDSV